MIRGNRSHDRQSRLCRFKVSDRLDCENVERQSFTHEQIVCVWYISTNAEQLHQIVKLTVYVTAYLK